MDGEDDVYALVIFIQCPRNISSQYTLRLHLVGSIRVIYVRGGFTFFLGSQIFSGSGGDVRLFFSFSFRFLKGADVVVGGEGWYITFSFLWGGEVFMFFITNS